MIPKYLKIHNYIRIKRIQRYRITGVPKIKETDLPEYNDTVILGLNHEGILSYTKRKDSGIQG